METSFSVFEVLMIAGEVEHKAAKFYLKAAERFTDRQRRNICYNLASWRAKHQQAWERIRREYSQRTGEFGTFDPDDYYVSNPGIMAGLAGFSTDPDTCHRPTGSETRRQLVEEAINRAKGVIVFYHGLKEFAADPAGRTMIDRMISEEDRHIRLLNRSIERMFDPEDQAAKSFQDSAVAGLYS